MRIIFTPAIALLLAACATQTAVSEPPTASNELKPYESHLLERLFQRADLDRNDAITEAEQVAYLKAEFAQPYHLADCDYIAIENLNTKFGPRHPIHLHMNMIDTDKDGRVSEAEFVTGRALPGDANSDNQITRTEYAAYLFKHQH